MSTDNSKYGIAILFGRIEYDGRVQRILNSLETNYDITLICLGISNSIGSNFGYNVIRIDHHYKYILHIKLLIKVLKEVKSIKPDFIIAHDYSTSFTGYLAKLFHRVKLIVDSHELIIPHALGHYNLRERIWFHLDRIALKNADLVICASSL